MSRPTFLAWIPATFDSTEAAIVAAPEGIDQLEFHLFLAPGLADSHGALNGMEMATQVRYAWRIKPR